MAAFRFALNEAMMAMTDRRPLKPLAIGESPRHDVLGMLSGLRMQAFRAPTDNDKVSVTGWLRIGRIIVWMLLL